MSYLRLLQSEIELVRSEVAQLTGISEEKQNLMLFERGYQWLELTTDNDAQALQHMPRTKEFWGFWKKTWHQADKAFVEFFKVYGRNCPKSAPMYYEHFHRVTKDNALMSGTSVQCDYHLLIKGLATQRNF